MKTFALRVLLGLTLAPLVACGGGDGGGSAAVGGGGGMSILSCTLGCNGSGGGSQTCTVSAIFVNQDLWLEFSQPVDLSSVNKNSFQVVNATTGSTPSGFYQLDPNNPRRVAFRPQLSFDSTGNPVFGLEAGQSYRVTVAAGNSGAVIRSTSGTFNTTPVQCFVQTSLGVNDPVPGPPLVDVFVEQVTGGLPTGTVAAQGAVDVPVNSRLRFVFDDIMNPATLVNPATGQSNFILVSVDLDGDLATAGDQLQLTGTFTIAVDDLLRRTTVTFTPAGSFPGAGSNPLQQRRIAVDLPPTILDLGGNSLANAGQVAFTTESIAFPATVLPGQGGEDFTSTAFLSLPHTGAILSVTEIAPGVLEGRAQPGFGGGSGRFGDLVVRAGQVLLLNANDVGSSFGPGITTDLNNGNRQTFVLDNYDPGLGEIPGTENFAALNGLFEFASLVVEPGATLRAAGSNALRLYVRGEANIRGIVALSGSPPNGNHPGNVGFGQVGGVAGAGGGAGGDGGDRQNTTGTALSGATGGFSHGIGVVVDMNGQNGGGRGGAPAAAGNGGGGTRWPATPPGPAVVNLGGFEPNNLCVSVQVGAPGAGGTFGTFGFPGVWGSPLTLFGTPVGPPAASGGAELLRASDTTLDPELGLLVGGAGGGGGGAGIASSRSNGQFFNCSAPLGPVLQIVEYRDASGAGGGGAGGGIQIQAGRRLFVEGAIDLRGGRGGNAIPPGPVSTNTVDPTAMAAPGGGGSGGAALLQSLDVTLAAISGVVDVRGGEGGFNPFGFSERNPSTGGAGGAGILRIEKSPLLNLTLASEAPKLLPSTGGVGEPPTADLLAVADWSPGTSGPGAQSGLQSCWLIPSGAVFQVDYLDDDLSDPLNPVLGWNMALELVGGIQLDYRGPGLAQAVLGQDLESYWGGDLGTAPILVRFQGARVVGVLEQACTADPSDPLGPFLVGSLTPWVRHPAELNTYWNLIHPGDPGLAAKLKPNAIRYQIVFDRAAFNGGLIQSVRSLFLRAQPD